MLNIRSAVFKYYLRSYIEKKTFKEKIASLFLKFFGIFPYREHLNEHDNLLLIKKNKQIKKEQKAKLKRKLKYSQNDL